MNKREFNAEIKAENNPELNPEERRGYGQAD